MDNILLDEKKENIKLTDFGLSNIYNPEQQLKTQCGSPEYAAPELFIPGQKYGPEIDIWSLGVVFFGMMNGKLPFQAKRNTLATAEEKRKHLIAEISEGLAHKQKLLLLSNSPLFRNLITKMLEPNPRKRLTISKIKLNSWIYSNAINEFIDPDDEWFKLTIKTVAIELSMTIAEVQSNLLNHAYGPIGGILNIKKHSWQLNRFLVSQNLMKTQPIGRTFKSIRPNTTKRQPTVERPSTVSTPKPTPLYRSIFTAGGTKNSCIDYVDGTLDVKPHSKPDCPIHKDQKTKVIQMKNIFSLKATEKPTQIRTIPMIRTFNTPNKTISKNQMNSIRCADADSNRKGIFQRQIPITKTKTVFETISKNIPSTIHKNANLRIKSPISKLPINCSIVVQSEKEAGAGIFMRHRFNVKRVETPTATKLSRKSTGVFLESLDKDKRIHRLMNDQKDSIFSNADARKRFNFGIPMHTAERAAQRLKKLNK